MRRTAEREAAALDPELRAQLERFCAGVNAAAASARAAAASRCSSCACGFEPWRPVDILSLGKLLAFGLSTNWERELLRADMARELGPELAARLDPVYPAEQPVVASPGSLDRATGSPSPSRSTRVRALARARGRGQRLEQLGGLRRAQRDRARR